VVKFVVFPLEIKKTAEIFKIQGRTKATPAPTFRRPCLSLTLALWTLISVENKFLFSWVFSVFRCFLGRWNRIRC